jgi:NAD(P)-dependent dehydrogenase (short-subunit alcohol dehydrogenase family)
MGGEIAVIVGAGPGLGIALAQKFVCEGMRVAAAARGKEKVGKLIAERGLASAEAYECDGTDPASVAALFAALPAPALVVFNAGAFVRGAVAEALPEEVERAWRTGCFGGFLVGQAAARAMLPQGRGTILFTGLFTGATAGLRGGAGFAPFAMAKFGLRALAQSMARELGPKGIHVAHIVIDGIIARAGGQETALSPAAIAEAYWQLHRQEPSAWSQELDLRPYAEKF